MKYPAERLLKRAIVAVIASLALVLGSVVPAQAATTITLSGHVYLGDESRSAGAGEVDVTVLFFGQPRGTTTTDANGDYEIEVTPNSSLLLTLKFDYRGAETFSSGYWPGTFDQFFAGRLVVESRSGLDIVLAAPAPISGQVFLGGPENPAPRYEVRVIYGSTAPGSSYQAVAVGVNGLWETPPLPAGQYAIWFDYLGTGGYSDTSKPPPPNYTFTWGSFEYGSTILYQSSSINGEVFLGSPGVRAGSGEVRVTWEYQEDISAPWVPNTDRQVVTDSLGRYSINELPAGNYRFTYTWVGSPSSAFGTYKEYTPVVLLADIARFGITGVLPPLWSAGGQVDLEFDGDPAAAGSVRASALSVENGSVIESVVTSAVTMADGTYLLEGLPTGQYVIKYDYLSGDDTYPTWYVGDGIESQILAEVEVAPLRVEANMAGVDPVVGRGPAITGTVTDSSGEPLGGQLVQTFAYDDAGIVDGTPAFSFTTTTKADGTYRLRALPDGYSYQVDFGGDELGQYAYESWNDASFYYAVDLIEVAQGDTSVHGGIDAELERPATISGVIGVSGPVPPGFDITTDLVAEVLVRDGTTNTWVETGDYYDLDPTGRYTIPGLKPDGYRVAVYFVGDGAFTQLRSPVLNAVEGANLVYSSTIPLKPMTIAQLHSSLGGASGALGAPVSGVGTYPNAGGGSLQHFANGSIYSSNVAGTYVVWAGPIREAYWAANSIFGLYGWPVGERDCETGTCTQQFMGGSITPQELVVSVVPKITGATRVGGVLVANAGTYSPAATSVRYAWLRDGVRVAGATGSTYTLTAADAGRTLQVEVTASRAGSVPTVALSVATAAITPSATMQIASLYSSLGGSSGQLGAATSAAVAFSDNGGGVLQHFVGGSIYSSNVSGTWVVWAGPIRDAYWAARSIFGTYRWPSGAQTCTGGSCSQAFSGGTITAQPIQVTVAPKVTGPAQVGATLLVNLGAHSPTPTSFTFAWLRNGVRIPGATGSTYVPVAADAGRTLQAEVTASRAGSVSVTTVTAPTAAIGPSGASLIATMYASLGGSSGQLGPATSAAVAFPDNGGGTLQHFTNGSIYSSALSGTWVVKAGPIRDAYWAARSIFGTYRWPSGAQTCTGGVCTQQFAGGTITRSPSATMQIASLYSSLGGSSGQLGAATSAAVAFSDNGGGVLQHFVGGSIYSSNVSGTWVVWAGPIRDAYWSARSIFGTYRWPSGAQTCTGGSCSQAFSGGTITAQPIQVTVAPKVTGPAQVGATLLVNLGAHSPTPTSFTFAWLRNGVRIPGATASTYVPVAADAGRTLQAEVTASRAGSVSVTTVTAPTAAIGPSGASLIATMYASLGGSSGQLGPATSAAVAFPDNGGGTLQHFTNGSIYSSALSGTWVVRAGPIRDAYWAARSIFGTYRWPSGAQTCTGSVCSQQFIGGTITR